MDLFGDLPEPEQSKKATDDQDSGQDTNTRKSNVDVKEAVSEVCVGEKRKLPWDATSTSTEENGGSHKKLDVAKESKCRYRLKGYVADRQGEREDMQDAHVIIDDLKQSMPDVHSSIHRLCVYAVFDGHGGIRASRFASQHLLNNLRDKFPKGDVTQVEKEIKKVLRDAFKKTDEDFLKEATKNKPSWKDGTTAVMVVGINDTLYIANLGDSKAILCRYKESEGKHVAIPLTADHNPTVYEERMRIQKAGGFVKEGRVMGQLEVARSIGDGPYKNHGVTCVPDIRRCQLTENDRFLMIACDGLWKIYTAEESIQTALNVLEDKKTEGTERKSAEDVRYDLACSRLASSAVLRLSGDNVTVMLVSVNQLGEDS
ncbi:integrin-linked kinase-associated serine/threonine phosphatase 2C [Aplysia californica]|uniref:Integrin-linked kinase-associated serine/threonine phosphatase 2C n=1 Tax=Aplysia californica TaxID=6500 RepID=A0ABM0JUN6_APLCA|nr:integrin-linked kinase-associated serine/threonine phosphatase 2C [Aplysia californica]